MFRESLMATHRVSGVNTPSLEGEYVFKCDAKALEENHGHHYFGCSTGSLMTPPTVEYMSEVELKEIFQPASASSSSSSSSMTNSHPSAKAVRQGCAPASATGGTRPPARSPFAQHDLLQFASAEKVQLGDKTDVERKNDVNGIINIRPNDMTSNGHCAHRQKIHIIVVDRRLNSKLRQIPSPMFPVDASLPDGRAEDPHELPLTSSGRPIRGKGLQQDRQRAYQAGYMRQVTNHWTYGQVLSRYYSLPIYNLAEKTKPYLDTTENLQAPTASLQALQTKVAAGRESTFISGLVPYNAGFVNEFEAETARQRLWCCAGHAKSLVTSGNNACADFYSTSKHGIAETWCESAIETEIGYTYRKQPTPNFDQAIAYYDKALLASSCVGLQGDSGESSGVAAGSQTTGASTQGYCKPSVKNGRHCGALAYKAEALIQRAAGRTGIVVKQGMATYGAAQTPNPKPPVNFR